jgi:hypothetical protein
MNKIFTRLTSKKVEMKDVVSPYPSKSALRVIKNALNKSYADQQVIREKATSLRNN